MKSREKGTSIHWAINLHYILCYMLLYFIKSLVLVRKALRDYKTEEA